MIHIYYGDGKGKTTAAVGLAVRAAGAGLKVHFTQFLKDNTGNERKILKEISGITIAESPDRIPFFVKMTEEEKRDFAAFSEKLFQEAELAALWADVVILDEVLDAINIGFIPKERMIEFMKNKPKEVELVLTGHEPNEELLTIADYCSEIRAVKHPFKLGVYARKGIEY